jgi:transposase
MSFTIKKKKGAQTYLYEVTAYRNSDGEPRNRRVIIGKVDAVTSKTTYKPEYIKRMAEAGTPLETSISSETLFFSTDDIKKSDIREYGAYYFIKKIAEMTGMMEILKAAVPTLWQELLTMAAYLICTEEPFVYCNHWIEATETLPVGNLSSQRISEILSGLTDGERERFFTEWVRFRSEQEYLALDITSVSSWSELIEDVGWGHNRDHDPLPQINICMLMGEDSRLPIYQVIYEGSLNDVATLKTTLDRLLNLDNSNRPILTVMDKGFYSQRNVDMMLAEPRMRFIIPISFTAKSAKSQVNSEKKDIDTVRNTIACPGGSVRGVTKTRVWDGGVTVYTHIIYNALKAYKRKDELYAYVSKLIEIAAVNPDNKNYSSDIEKYLIVRSSSTAESGRTINIRDDVIEDELGTTGWLILISNQVRDCKEALAIYRDKDVVEKGFLRLKKSIDLGRLRVHSQTNMRNKVFVGFLSLILLSHMNKVMVEKDLYRRMTMKEMLIVLKKLRVQYINGARILFPLNKTQKVVLEAFSIQEPV